MDTFSIASQMARVLLMHMTGSLVSMIHFGDALKKTISPVSAYL